MALFSRVKTWVSNEVLTAADLNAEFDNILNNSVASSIIGASANVTAMRATVDPGDVGSESLAASVAGELQRLRYVIKRIVGGTQWYEAPLGNLGAGGITRKNLEPLGQVISNSSGTFAHSGAEVEVTNLTCTKEFTGRPVFIGLIHDGSGLPSYVSSPEGRITIKRGDTTIYTFPIEAVVAAGGDEVVVNYPVSSIWHVDAEANTPGTYTYKVFASSEIGAIEVFRAKLLVYEL